MVCGATQASTAIASLISLNSMAAFASGAASSFAGIAAHSASHAAAIARVAAGSAMAFALPNVAAWVSWIGWVATAAFGVSYFAKTPKMLRVVQACAALLWIAYGFIIHAMPVVVANAIVAGAAVYSSFAATKLSNPE